MFNNKIKIEEPVTHLNFICLKLIWCAKQLLTFTTEFIGPRIMENLKGQPHLSHIMAISIEMTRRQERRQEHLNTPFFKIKFGPL
jgi:hypothetical protein